MRPQEPPCPAEPLKSKKEDRSPKFGPKRMRQNKGRDRSSAFLSFSKGRHVPQSEKTQNPLIGLLMCTVSKTGRVQGGYVSTVGTSDHDMDKGGGV